MSAGFGAVFAGDQTLLPQLSRQDREQVLEHGVGMRLSSRQVFGHGRIDFVRALPQQRLFLACTFEALETAGKDPGTGAAKIGVFAGCGLNTYLINQVLPSEGVRARAFPETTRELQILLANAAASMPMPYNPCVRD